ncbi:MAG: hypothetical protein LBU81_08165 [Methanosarcinales archaeon]|jgi:hypothetical protein|nr:hypothetical protein [Methanosarcinales archaeon]
MIRDGSGVSSIFGASLLLAILVVFLSAFLITAVPAKIMAEESEYNNRLVSDLLRFSEQKHFGGSFFLKTDYTSVTADEISDQIIFTADLTLLPETKTFLKTEGDFSSFDSDLLSQETFCLSSGALLFSNSYSQIPDSVYSLGASSILQIQDDGFSFLKTPDIFFRRGKNGQILLIMSGDFVKLKSSPVFGDRICIRSFTIQSAEVYDSVSAVAFQYIPSHHSKISFETMRPKAEAFKKWAAQFENELARDFPELKIENDAENLILIISSETPFDIDLTVREIEFDFSS